MKLLSGVRVTDCLVPGSEMMRGLPYVRYLCATVCYASHKQDCVQLICDWHAELYSVDSFNDTVSSSIKFTAIFITVIWDCE